MTRTALFSNTLVSLPTGLGKTLIAAVVIIAAVVMYNYFRWFPQDDHMLNSFCKLKRSLELAKQRTHRTPAPALPNQKKPKFGGEGQYSKSASKRGSHKRKALEYEGQEDGGSRNPHSKKPVNKQKGNIHGRERDNYRNPNSGSSIRRGHDVYRFSTRYIDPYAPAYAASNVYHLAPDSLFTRHFKDMVELVCKNTFHNLCQELLKLYWIELLLLNVRLLLQLLANLYIAQGDIVWCNAM